MQNSIVALVVFGEESANKIALALTKLKINFQSVFPDQALFFEPTHIILSGGPDHVYEKGHSQMPSWVVESAAPVLGICYGMQLIAETNGGVVRPLPKQELGAVNVTEIINGSQITQPRWMNRFDRVLYIPKSFHVTGVTQNNDIAAFTDHRKWWAVQYHPESEKYRDLEVFRRFLNNRINIS
jgi:GMP synthase (glutamine-hydrolysing)